MGETVEVICHCNGFHYWYTTDNGLRVCRCGHSTDDHIDGERVCVGISEVTR